MSILFQIQIVNLMSLRSCTQSDPSQKLNLGGSRKTGELGEKPSESD